MFGMHHRRFHFLGLVACVSLFAGCFGESKVSGNPQADDPFEAFVAETSFAGISSIDQVTDTSVRVNWQGSSDAIHYNIYDVTNSSITSVSQVESSSTTYTITGLSPSTTYKFRVRIVDAQGRFDQNKNDVTITTLSQPDSPSSISLSSPSVSPGSDTTPTLQVGGLGVGSTLKIYSASNCSAGSELASISITTPTMNITPTLTAATNYTIYAAQTNSEGTKSPCSTVNISYTVCPASYIGVPSNAVVGQSNGFCVAKYEMKDDGGGNAVSQVTGTPWVSISQNNARAQCSALGANYTLISKEQWQTIARNIDTTASNWSSGTVGTGFINRGHSDNSPASPLAADADDDQACSGTEQTCSSSVHHQQRRTHVLSNGQVIWDFAGNVMEWLDWNVTPANKAYNSGDGAPQTGNIEYTALDTNINNGDEMETITWQASVASYDSTNGIGRYYAGNNTTGGAALRGGSYNAGVNSGIYGMEINAGATLVSPILGFRCVFSPP